MAVFQNIEYVYQIFVPEHVWDDPCIQKKVILGSLHMSESNDLYSFEKEEKECEPSLLCGQQIADRRVNG